MPTHLSNQACDVQIKQLVLAIAERHSRGSYISYLHVDSFERLR